ncbi:MAG: alpha-ketoacid dehydrogenase subunit beta [Anaerolineae bacterium]|nr:MAG: alpha-ketoacid dehydrogenase subunit beta [Anaerolineae bacterium]
MPTVLDSLNAGLHRAFAEDERVLLLGEDILDPYGGAFKVPRGLATQYPARVFTSPVSEAGLAGMAGGLALRGLKPVVEIMFGDFLMLTADQLLNSITKFGWMYGGQVDVPLVIRTPMGGRRGYGPTHSQTIEKHFLGVPGLTVLAPAALGNPGALLADAILNDPGPVLFVENKLLYLEPARAASDLPEFELTPHTFPGDYAPAYSLRISGAPPPTVTIAAYGYAAELARKAALLLAYEHEIFVEVLVPTRISFPGNAYFDNLLLPAVQRTGRLLAVEEGTAALGWGAEVLARVAETLGSNLRAAGRVAAEDTPIPASTPMEDAALPQAGDIVREVIRIASR